MGVRVEEVLERLIDYRERLSSLRSFGRIAEKLLALEAGQFRVGREERRLLGTLAQGLDRRGLATAAGEHEGRAYEHGKVSNPDGTRDGNPVERRML